MGGDKTMTICGWVCSYYFLHLFFVFQRFRSGASTRSLVFQMISFGSINPKSRLLMIPFGSIDPKSRISFNSVLIIKMKNRIKCFDLSPKKNEKMALPVLDKIGVFLSLPYFRFSKMCKEGQL